MSINLSEPVKITLDALAVVVSVVSWLSTLLPALASLVTLAWGVIRIYEWWKGKKNGNVKLD